jgi:hypothetical protein
MSKKPNHTEANRSVPTTISHHPNAFIWRRWLMSGGRGGWPGERKSELFLCAKEEDAEESEQ